jgi:hypothetical protein
MGEVSTDEKDIRELDIMFSKVWSENMSSISIKYFCCHPSSRAVAHSPVNRKSRDFRWFLLYGYIILGRHISPEAGRANMALTENLGGPYKLHTHFCPCLMLKHSLGIIKTLFLHH